MGWCRVVGNWSTVSRDVEFLKAQSVAQSLLALSDYPQARADRSRLRIHLASQSAYPRGDVDPVEYR